MVTFLDDFSKFLIVQFLKHKSETFGSFVAFKNYVENFHGRKIKSLQSDNGTEYCNSSFSELFKAEGISHRKIVVGCSSQNGVAERVNRTIVEMARCLLLQAGLPEYFWAEASSVSCYIRNLCVNSSINNQIPVCLWRRQVNVPDLLSKLRVFGCRVWSLIDKDLRTKFGPKAEACVFMGYGDCYDVNVKGYKLFCLRTQKMIFRHHVIFEESVFPYKLDLPRNYQLNLDFDSKNEDVPIDFNNPIDDHELYNADDYDEQPVDVDPADLDVDQVPVPEVPVEPIVTPVPDVPVDVPVEPVRRSSRIPKVNSCSCCNLAIAKCPFSDYDAPINVCEALNGPDQQKWLQAMELEIQSLKSQHVWDIVARPSNKRLVDCRWVLRVKREPNGAISKFKARLVARGFSQVPGVDFEETYCPVVKRRSLRLLIAISVENDWTVEFLDVEGAYLNSPLQEEIFMRQPPYFEVNPGSGFVCKLNKSLYGLKQGGRDWYRHVNQIMLSLDFKRCVSDTCVFTAKKGQLIVAWYVDDACVCGIPKYVSWFISSLSKLLKVKSLGSNSQYLSVKVTTIGNCITLDQTHYISDKVQRYPIPSDVRGFSSPLDVQFQHSQNSESFHVKTYQEAIGSLLYLSNNTRPDLSFAVSRLSQVCSNPTEVDWKNVLHVFSYLANSKNLRLCYRRTSKPIQVFCDSDYAGDLTDRKSRSGYVIMLAGSAVSWFSKKQTCTATSTLESEYIAMCEVSKELLWLKSFLCELNQQIFMGEPASIFCDNQGAIENVVNHDKNVSERTKHIAIKYFFCKELVLKNVVNFNYVKSESNIADGFTKPLKGPLHNLFVRRLGLK